MHDPRIELAHLGKQKITKATHIDFKYRDKLYGNDIDGWMSFNELNWLYHNVKKNKIQDIVEIGSFKGRSTHALLSAAQFNQTVNVPPSEVSFAPVIQPSEVSVTNNITAQASPAQVIIPAPVSVDIIRDNDGKAKQLKARK